MSSVVTRITHWQFVVWMCVGQEGLATKFIILLFQFLIFIFHLSLHVNKHVSAITLVTLAAVTLMQPLIGLALQVACLKTYSHFVLLHITFLIVVLLIILVLFFILIIVISGLTYHIRNAIVVCLWDLLVNAPSSGNRFMIYLFLPHRFVVAVRGASSFPLLRLSTDGLVS